MNADPSYLVDRELSWLKFNERVLEEAGREDVPLCERLQFLRIFQTNLDEFFKVRVGTLVDHSGQEVADRLEAIRSDVNRLLVRKEEIYGELLSVLGALVAASRAGVKVDLVVRGICRLVPGLSDATENVRVVSIVGRFLEHARLYVFGRVKGATVYISSADFMTRNTTRRVEVAAPIRSQSLRRLLLGMFETMLEDNRQSWQMGPDGTYSRTPPGDPSVSSQERFCENR